MKKLSLNRWPYMIGFLIAAVGSLGALVFFYGVKYSAPVGMDDQSFTIVMAAFYSGLVGIVMLWCIYPSRILVGLIGLITLLFRDPFNVRVFRGPDSTIYISDFFPNTEHFIAAVVIVGLLVGTTELRRRFFGKPSRQ